MAKNLLLIATALLAGAAIGYSVKRGDVAPQTVGAEEPTHHSHAVISDKGEAASNVVLRARVRDLEGQLAALTAYSNDLAKANGVQQLTQGHRPQSHREWMEELKKNDPKRYAEITNNMARVAERRRNWQQTKLDFLATVNTQSLEGNAKTAHETLQDLILRREELEEQVRDDELSDEDRRALFNKIWENDREIRKLNVEERKMLLEGVGKGVGLNASDSAQFVETVQDIIDVTSDMHIVMPPQRVAPPAAN